MRELCIEAEVRLVARQMTVDLFDYGREQYIPEVQEWVGAECFLPRTHKAGVNLLLVGFVMQTARSCKQQGERTNEDAEACTTASSPRTAGDVYLVRLPPPLPPPPFPPPLPPRVVFSTVTVTISNAPLPMASDALTCTE